MSYDEIMAQQYPAKMSAGAEHADSRTPFHVARCFKNAREGYDTTDTASCEPQVTDFVNRKRHEHVDTPATQRDTIYTPIARAAEIRVLEVLPAAFDQPISGSLHRVSIDFELEDKRKSCAVSVSKMAIVCYTALSYVVSLT